MPLVLWNLLAETFDYGISDVCFIGRTEGFADEVLDTGKADNRTDDATSNNTSTWSSRLHENVSASDFGFNFVADSFAIHVDGNHIFLGAAFSFLNGGSNIRTLGETNADTILVITDCNECLEAHTATTSDGARNAVD